MDIASRLEALVGWRPSLVGWRRDGLHPTSDGLHLTLHSTATKKLEHVREAPRSRDQNVAAPEYQMADKQQVWKVSGVFCFT